MVRRTGHTFQLYETADGDIVAIDENGSVYGLDGDFTPQDPRTLWWKNVRESFWSQKLQ